MQSNVRDNVLFSSPKDEVERAYVAGACVRKLGIKFPALVDGFDNRVESAYTGWPDRLYLIGKGGRVFTRASRGPSAFTRTIWHRPSKHRSRLTEHRRAYKAPRIRLGTKMCTVVPLIRNAKESVLWGRMWGQSGPDLARLWSPIRIDPRKSPGLVRCNSHLERHRQGAH
jgi:type I thyroxine 5'-deiodinase